MEWFAHQCCQLLSSSNNSITTNINTTVTTNINTTVTTNTNTTNTNGSSNTSIYLPVWTVCVYSYCLRTCSC